MGDQGACAARRPCRGLSPCKAPGDNAGVPACSRYATTKPSCTPPSPPSSILPQQGWGLSPQAEGLGRCQSEVLLNTPSHCLAIAAPRPCLLQHPSTSVLAPLYPPFCPDNRSSSSSSSSWYPWGLRRQLPSLPSSLTPLRIGRRRHHQQFLSPPIPSPSLP